MLDTDICINFLRGSLNIEIIRRARGFELDELGISVVTLAELCYGANRSARPDHNHRLIAEFCGPLAVTDFDANAAKAYGRIRAELESAGTPIGPHDMLIAAHAVSLGTVLVTRNVREFSRVSGLEVQRW
jgi:tRNA(fMet)-specific endonuclease VapC